MLISRCLSLGSTAKKNFLLENKRNCLTTTLIRNKWYYRQTPPLDAYKDSNVVLFGTSFFWWWIFWHFFTDYETFLGYNYPDPSKWTNEELGIPED